MEISHSSLVRSQGPSKVASIQEPQGTDNTNREAWFAVFTRSHHEKRVAQHLLRREIENYLPLYSEVHHWTNRRKARVELPLFPNYLFARIGRREIVRLLQAPGVLSVVGGSKPVSLPEWEIESLRAGLGQRKFEPHPLLVVGERVVIRTGPLTGMEGILVRRKSGLRVVITVSQISQSVAIEVDTADIEPVAKSRKSLATATGCSHSFQAFFPSSRAATVQHG